MLSNKYSVLMSVYEKEDPIFFSNSIKSMLEQTLKPNEIVIVKDGPLTEKLENVISHYNTEYPRLFKIVGLETNSGLGPALNLGIKNCTNELIARMDTDDISLPERCELQVQEFQKNNNLSICGTLTLEFYDDPDNIVSSREVPITHKEILKFSKRRSPFNHPTVMYKKSAVLNCGGYRAIERKEDIDLFVRMLNDGCQGMNINQGLLLFRSNEDNFKRRKSWVNCKSYINVIYDFYKNGYSSLWDLIVVILGQLIMVLSPVWLLKIISGVLLRKKAYNPV